MTFDSSLSLALWYLVDCFTRRNAVDNPPPPIRTTNNNKKRTGFPTREPINRLRFERSLTRTVIVAWSTTISYQLDTEDSWCES